MNKFTSLHKRIFEAVVVLFILVASFSMRYKNLESDPPIGLSISTSVYTDHAQYTLFAKQKISDGVFNSQDDPRFVFFLKSTMTLLALAVFKIFGVSIFASNLTGLIYSFGALLLFYLFIRKVGGAVAGIIFLLLIGVNYNHIFFGRLPFLEHAMTFYAFLSAVLLVYFKNIPVMVVSGISLATAIFFGKVIGLVFLCPFFLYFVFRYFFEDKKTIKIFLFFSSGFIAVVLFWLLFSYLPMKQQVTSYVGEQAFSLYGAPEAFESFNNFVKNFVNFGAESKLNERMPIPAILALSFVGFFFIQFLRKNIYKTKMTSWNAGEVFVVTMIIAFFLSLMIWNYRPLRYQLVLVYAACGASALLLQRVLTMKPKLTEEKISYLAAPLIFLILYLIVYQLYSFLVVESSVSSNWDAQKYIAAAIAIILTIILYLNVSFVKTYKLSIPGYLRFSLMVIVILGNAVLSIPDYISWDDRPTFTARDNSHDFNLLLSKNAVISGPYAPALNLESDYSTIIHMFGVSQPDPDLFKKFPITHLLLDAGNEEKAKEDYPKIMDSAKHLVTYHLGLQKIRLYRIAGFTGNPIADNYQKSDFELLIEQYDGGDGFINNDLTVQLISKYPNNISYYSFLAEAAEIDSIYQLSELMFKKAVEFSPTNYNLNARLAKYYQERYNESKGKQYKIESRHYYQEAIHVAPTVQKLKSSLEELNRS